MLQEIDHTIAHFGGIVEGTAWPIPGFCLPLQFLPFEAMQKLGDEFRVTYPDADPRCPRMCKKNFKKTDTKGIPRAKINKALSSTKDIQSILPLYSDEERNLLARLTEDDDDVHDDVVCSWMKRFRRGLTIVFDDMYYQDKYGRREPGEEPATNTGQQGQSVAKLIDLVKSMEEQIQNLKDIVTLLEADPEDQVDATQDDSSDGSTEPPTQPIGTQPQQDEVVGPQNYKPSPRVTRSKKNRL